MCYISVFYPANSYKAARTADARGYRYPESEEHSKTAKRQQNDGTGKTNDSRARNLDQQVMKSRKKRMKRGTGSDQLEDFIKIEKENMSEIFEDVRYQ